MTCMKSTKMIAPFRAALLACSVGLIALVATPALCDSIGMTKGSQPTTAGKVGVGVAFEGAAGLSLYADTGADRFAQGAFAWSPHGAYAVTGDYAFGYPGLFGARSLTPFWGIGAIALKSGDGVWGPSAIDDSERINVGARIPLGLNFVIPSTPVQIGAELVPTLLVAPASYSYVQGGAYARVLF